jgi:hypothetical protein
MRALLQEQIERQLTDLNQRGQLVSCPDMRIAGFPFRFEVSCRDPSVADPAGRKTRLKDLRVVALVYNPWHVIAEADGPALLEDPVAGLATLANWQRARSSIIYSLETLKQADVVFDDLSLAMPGSDVVGEYLSVRAAEGHLRQMPDELTTLEAFVSLKEIVSTLLPGATSPFDAQLHLQIEHGTAFLSRGGVGDLLKTEGSLPLRLVTASIESDEMAISGSGDLSLDTAGLLSGKIELSVTNVEGLSALLSNLFPEAGPVLDTLKGAALSFGAKTTSGKGQQQIDLPLTLQNGRVSVGILPVGIIPPIAIKGTTAGS